MKMFRTIKALFPSNGSPRLYATYVRKKPTLYKYNTHFEYRESLGLPARLNHTKELQEYKDYSFNDGRPTPVTPRQLKNILIQRQLAAAAVQQLKEIKFIQDRQSQKVQGKLADRQLVLDSKLKPKGDALLIKSKNS